MATDNLIFTVELTLDRKTAVLLENTARLRTRQMDRQVPVDWVRYLWAVLNQDVAACIEEIKERRSV